MDARILTFMQKGDTELALQLMLGADQYNRIITTDKLLAIKGTAKLVEQYALHNGLTVGESAASSTSSPTSSSSSRPTSSGSTKRTSAA